MYDKSIAHKNWIEKQNREFEINRKRNLKKVKKWRKENKEKVKEYERRTIIKRVEKTGSTVSNKFHQKARDLVNVKIRTNYFERGNCSICEKPRAEAHHEDYSKPLHIVWLCGKHHRAFHNGKLLIEIDKFIIDYSNIERKKKHLT